MTSVAGRAARACLLALAGGVALAILLLSRGGQPAASAATTCTTTWTGATSQNWLSATNWSTHKVPAGADWVCIPTRAHNLPVVISSTVNIIGMTNAGGLSMLGALNLSSKTTASTSTGPLTASGPFSVAHSLTVSGRFLSTGGTLGGAGTVTIERGATWTVKSGAAIATTVANDGAIVVPANGVFTIATGGRLDNIGSTTVLPGGGIYGSCSGHATTGGVLVNAGTLTFSAGTGNVSNLGGLEPAESCLDVQDNARLQVLSGAALVKQGAVLELDHGSSVSGAGVLELGGAAGRAGTLKVNAGSTVPNLDVSGGASVTGAANLTVSGSLVTSGGTLAGTGTASLIVAKSAKWTASGGVLFMRMLNEGSATVPANGRPELETTGVLTNTGSITLDDAAGLYGLCKGNSTTGGVLVNKGTVEFAPGVGDSAFLGDIETGENCLDVRDAGRISILSGSAIVYQNASLDLNAGATVAGPGVLMVGGAGTANAGVGTLNVNADSTVPNLGVAAPGIVADAAALTISGNLATAGGVLAGSGSVTVGSTASWAASGGTIETSVTNHGSATVSAGGSLVVDSLATLGNTGTVTLGNGAGIYGSCVHNLTTGGTVLNSGTISFNPGVGNAASLGDVETEEACLVVHDSGTVAIATGSEALVHQDATLDLETGSSVVGAGTLVVGVAGGPTADAGTLNATAHGRLNVAALDVESGMVTVQTSGDLAVSALTTGSASTLTGGGGVTVGTTWSAGGGSIDTPLTNNGAATFLEGASVTVTRNGTLDNALDGSLTLTSALLPGVQLIVDGFGQVTNEGTLTLGDNASIDGYCVGSTAGELDNTATGTLVFAPQVGDAAYLGDVNDAGACLNALDEGTFTVSTNRSAVVWAQAALTFDSGSPKVEGPGTLVIGGGFGPGTLVVNTAASIDDLEVSTGQVEGAKDLIVNTSFKTDAGSTLAGPGSVTVNGTWTATGGSVATTVTIAGGASATVPNNDVITVDSGGDIANSGTLTMLADTAIEGFCPANPPGGVVDNTAQGTLVFDPGAGKFASLYDDREPNDPCLEVDDFGTVQLKSGETLVYNMASFNLGSSQPIAGTGTLVVGDGTNEPLAPWTLDVATSASMASATLEIDGGTVGLASGATLTTANLIGLAGTVVATDASGSPYGQIDVMPASSVALDVSALALDIPTSSTPSCPATEQAWLIAVPTGSTVSNFGSKTVDTPQAWTLSGNDPTKPTMSGATLTC